MTTSSSLLNLAPSIIDSFLRVAGKTINGDFIN